MSFIFIYLIGCKSYEWEDSNIEVLETRISIGTESSNIDDSIIYSIKITNKDRREIYFLPPCSHPILHNVFLVEEDGTELIRPSISYSYIHYPLYANGKFFVSHPTMSVRLGPGESRIIKDKLSLPNHVKEGNYFIKYRGELSYVVSEKPHDKPTSITLLFKNCYRVHGGVKILPSVSDKFELNRKE